jgi:hypothetical protein
MLSQAEIFQAKLKSRIIKNKALELIKLSQRRLGLDSGLPSPWQLFGAAPLLTLASAHVFPTGMCIPGAIGLEYGIIIFSKTNI